MPSVVGSRRGRSWRGRSASIVDSLVSVHVVLQVHVLIKILLFGEAVNVFVDFFVI